jgi:hypothetical protein
LSFPERASSSSGNRTGSGRAIAALRRIGHPSVFAIRPGPEFTAPRRLPGNGEPITMADLPDCAVRLAVTRTRASTRSRPLLPILRECEIVIERARADLAEAARLEYGITHAAEWLLDNAYLIRSNIADIRHNLPDNHNKILPVLKTGAAGPAARLSSCR